MMTWIDMFNDFWVCGLVHAFMVWLIVRIYDTVEKLN